MSDTDTDKLQLLLKQDIHAETSTIAWADLQRFFAAGRAIYVSTGLDLVDVALQLSSDNSNQVSQWMRDHKLAPVSDDQARCWIETNAVVWAVVVKPFVLVQDLKAQRNAH